MAERSVKAGQTIRYWVDGDTSLSVSVGRSQHPDHEGLMAWRVSLWDELTETKLAMLTGWGESLIGAAVEAAAAKTALIDRYKSGEWRGEPDEPF